MPALAPATTPPLLPYLRLLRAPAAFSALGDPLAGMLIAGERVRPLRAGSVAGAAAAFYLAGMALNDYADRERDAVDRPERPIPAGEVRADSAAAIGIALLLAGERAAVKAGAPLTGSALASAVMAYDFAFKETAAGPVAMGACRALSLLMGAEATGGTRGVLRATGAAAVLGAYIAGLTLVARGETEREGPAIVLPGLAIAGAALGGALVLGRRRAAPWVALTVALAAPAAMDAVRTGAPGAVGRTVGEMVRAVPAVDAALASRRTPIRAAAVALPLLALVRWGRRLIPIS